MVSCFLFVVGSSQQSTTNYQLTTNKLNFSSFLHEEFQLLQKLLLLVENLVSDINLLHTLEH